MALLEHTRPQEKRWTRTGWIGVEVGTCAIKLAQVERIAGQFQIARSLIVRSGENERFDRNSIEEGRVGREIRKALSTHGGFRGRLAACALSMHFCELRTLVSARGSEEEQRELISLELTDRPEAGTDAREFDFWDAATQRKDENGMTQVNVLSIPRRLSDSIATNLLDAGLRCRVLDGIPFAALRAVEMSASQVGHGRCKDEPVAVLDWDYSTATFVVIRDQEPLLTRSLRNCGLNRLLEKINQHLKLTRRESEILLTTYGVEGCRIEGEIASIITDLAREVLKELVEELNETLAFLRLQFADLMPTKVWLMGSGSSVRNITERLEMQIGIPTVLWGHPGHVVDSDQPPSVLGNAAALSALAWD